jgi:hypothetical protein
MNKFIRTDMETLLHNKTALDTAQAAAVTNIVLDGIAAVIAGGLYGGTSGPGNFRPPGTPGTQSPEPQDRGSGKRSRA